jgi:hypothetical protein
LFVNIFVLKKENSIHKRRILTNVATNAIVFSLSSILNSIREALTGAGVWQQSLETNGLFSYAFFTYVSTLPSVLFYL